MLEGGNIIYLQFLKLKPEKKLRILNAAMKEFAQKGFKNALTDVIVMEANISKGALFHYFNNKKELFLYLYDYTIDVLKNEILLKFNDNERDIFARHSQAMMLKIEVLNKHPEIYKFLASVYFEDSKEVMIDLESRNRAAINNYQVSMNKNIDTSKFKEGIDINTAIDIITWTIEGFTNKEMERLKRLSLLEINLKELQSEMNIYLEMLKKSFYL